MKYTLFISDLHLSEKRPEVLACFERFVEQYGKGAEALYILGDFFAQWVGDDDHSEFNAKVKAIVKGLVDCSVPVYLMPGNHDFMLGNDFAAASKCTLLPDPYHLNLHGKSILLTHGDLLCTKDWTMILFHDFLHSKLCRFLFLTMPVMMRKKIADLVENYIERSTIKGRKPKEVMQVQQDAIEQMMLKYEATQLIHGHVHREELSEFVLTGGSGGGLAKRIALDGWLKGSGLALFYWEDGSCKLKKLH